jgi:serine/threonine-protein kinase
MQGDGKTQSSMLAFGSPMPAPGDVIAEKYRVEAVLGRGGMSVVYRATHLQLDQQVAIKVLSAEALLLPEYVVRLKREARAVSRIRSEHVVRVHDIGELTPGGVPYLVMEHLSGLDLAVVLSRRGQFPVDLAVECILQACEALAEAHALGIIHRDLKPANLFLTEAVDGSPCVKVLDFGISRMSRRHGLSSLTDPGTVLGTPSYMAPEQMEAADTVDARSDIWALGTILYELLIGRPPYRGDSLPQIFMKIMKSRPPKPSSIRSDVPSGIDAVVGRCLEVEAPDRFQSVAELAWALSAVGTPHARDSAARISRVFDKHNAESTPSGTLRSTVPPAAVDGGEVRARRRSRSTRHLAAALASAAMLGAASVFAVLAARGAGTTAVKAHELPAVITEGTIMRTRPVPPVATARSASQARVSADARASNDDAAVAIFPAHRPAEGREVRDVSEERDGRRARDGHELREGAIVAMATPIGLATAVARPGVLPAAAPTSVARRAIVAVSLPAPVARADADGGSITATRGLEPARPSEPARGTEPGRGTEAARDDAPPASDPN